MASRDGLSRLFGSFNRTFWVVNTFELFERAAYYGMNAILGVYVINQLIPGPNAAFYFGVLYSMLVVFLYFFPVLAGAIAEKYGYRTSLAVAFALLVSGYALLSTVPPHNMTLLVLSSVLFGLGAGLFKPIVSATIAHVTSIDVRNQAYSIYYWTINMGSFSANVVLGLVMSAESVYHYIFLVSSALVAVNVAVLLLFFNNPMAPRTDLSVGDAVKRIVPALSDRRLVVLLLIYSGFWFVYTLNGTFLNVYMRDFGRMPSWFSVQFASAINPGTIILVGPFLAKAVGRLRSLSAMMIGISIFLLGVAITGFSRTPTLFFAGVVVIAVGEFITHPNFISYVSKIAPKDKVAIYMASIFLSTGIGQLVGGVVHGALYDHYARALERPAMYFAIILAVGVVTLLGFVVYNKRLIADMVRTDPSHVEPPSIWTRPITFAVVLLLVPVSIGGGILSGSSSLASAAEGGAAPAWSDYSSSKLTIDGTSGFTAEGDAWDGTVEVGVPNVARMTLTLTWTDEAAAGIRYTNRPDTFELAVTPPNGTERTSGEVSNPQGGSGTATVSFEFEGAKDPFWNGTGSWGIVVRCAAAGDQTPIINLAGLRARADTGNAWTLTVDCAYLERPAR